MNMRVIQTVTKMITTETAHRLLNYEGKCANVHGHSYRWEVTATRTADAPIAADNGILVDFGDLKRALQEVVHDKFDHALILHQDDPLVNALRGTSEFHALDNRFQTVPWNPTAENFARWAAQQLQANLDAQRECPADPYAMVVRVRVWETATCYAQHDMVEQRKLQHDLLFDSQ